MGCAKRCMALLARQPSVLQRRHGCRRPGLIHEAGLRVPQNISLAGFDDDLCAIMARPSLTTVAIPLREMTQTAMAKLREQVKAKELEPSCTLVPPHLIVRDSTAAAPFPP